MFFKEFLSLLFLVYIVDKSECVNTTVSVAFTYRTDASLLCGIDYPFTFYYTESSGAITEIKNDGSKYVIDNATKTLTLKTLRKADFQRNYYCTNAADRVTFNILRSPYLYLPDTNTETYISGYTATLNCYLLVGAEYNQAVTFTWVFNNKTLTSGDRYQITSTPTSTALAISDTRTSDTGAYYCMPFNSYGNHSRNITLKVKSNLAPIWPFIGTICEVVLIALSIIFYEKVVKPKEEGEKKSSSMHKKIKICQEPPSARLIYNDKERLTTISS